MAMKKLLIIIDGMDDEPIPEFGGKTPVQAADMQALSFMRMHGTVNRVEAVPERVIPSTDTALLTHLGYNINSDFKSRAWFEAMGSGILATLKDFHAFGNNNSGRSRHFLSFRLSS